MNNLAITCRSAIALTAVALTAAGIHSQDRDGLAVQRARAVHVGTNGKKTFYDPKMWDLSGLPPYRPEGQVAGTIRFWGNNYLVDGALGSYWDEGFRKFQPGVTLDMSNMKSGLIATAGLVSGAADIAGNRHITFPEIESFERMYNYDPIEIRMATGSYNVPGWMTTFCILLQKDNPIDRLTMKQLDGIFGTARDGGWEGTTWHPEAARGADENIRTWGQLGLTGEWTDKPIHVYGLNLTYNNCDMFQRAVFHGGDKWNENIREYANYAGPGGTMVIAAQQLTVDLGNDRYGIGWSGIQNLSPQTKAIAIASRDGGPFVPLTIENVQNRTYPLAFDMFFYVNRKPGSPLDPKVREFLKYVLSREGQEAVARDGKYLPMTAEMVLEDLKKLD